MDLLQAIDPAHLPFIVVGCALLCMALLVIGFVMQALSGIIEVLLGIFGALVDLLQGGPGAWLGCALAVITLAACAGIAFLLLDAPSSCAAQPTNFCRWFGFIP
ncbi:MAG: hypothetical protein OXE46_02130 [Chloroflexi bacterium]|nr:hypothetical protein [Chloroflexota bacterium]